MTCVWVLPGPPGLRLPPSGPQDACRELVLGHVYPGGRAVPVLGPRGASCSSGPWGPGQNRSAREAGRSRKKGLRPNASLGNAQSPPPSTHPGVSGHFINSSPRGEASPPGPSSPSLWTWPSDLGASLGGTVGGHRHPACPEPPDTAEGKGRFQRSHFLPPAINCKTQHQFHYSSRGQKETELTLYCGTAIHLTLRNTRTRGAGSQRCKEYPVLNHLGPLTHREKSGNLVPLSAPSLPPLHSRPLDESSTAGKNCEALKLAKKKKKDYCWSCLGYPSSHCKPILQHSNL